MFRKLVLASAALATLGVASIASVAPGCRPAGTVITIIVTGAPASSRAR